MADIVGVFATSHTPVMTNLPDAPPTEQRDAAFAEFARVGREIGALDPDALIVISDDHLHNFFLDNLPAFCIGAGEYYTSPAEGWLKLDRCQLRGDGALGAHILVGVMGAGFDPAFSMDLTLDHGFLTPLALAGSVDSCAIVPVLVNCVQPPMPGMQRCIDLGSAIGAAIRDYGGCERVAVLATGGISHDVGTPRMGFVNEQFDREFLRLIGDGEPAPLARFSTEQVDTAGNGAEEIRNWLVAHGIAGCAPFELYHYRAIRDWYTGIALGRWRIAA